MTSPNLPTRLSLLLIAAALLSACSFSLAADVTPPPGYRPPPTAQPSAPPSLPPVSIRPNPAEGAALFAEKCAPCHGATGLGDGPSAAQLPNGAPALALPDFARQASPAQWYTIVTQGKIEKLMPPFASLSDAQRWHVVAYAFSLSLTPQALARGRDLYQANCARCHGESGQGEGRDAPSQSKTLPDLSDPAFMASRSAAMLAEAISRHAVSPPFSETLSPEDRWALSDYLRSLTFADSPAVSPVLTPTALAASQTSPPVLSEAAIPTRTSLVRGQIINGSGGTLPPDLTVTLYSFDGMTVAFSQTTRIGPTGFYTFTDVAMADERLYIALTDYADVMYSSPVGSPPADDSPLDLPITIYDTTTDRSLLVVDRVHVILSFEEPGKVGVTELYIISNPSAFTVVAEQPDGAVVNFALPQGASNLQFESGALGERYLTTANGFADTEEVPPGNGEYQVLFAFDLPYERKFEWTQPMLANTASVIVMLPEAGVNLTSADLTDTGMRQLQGTVYHLYKGSDFGPHKPLKLVLSGRPSSGRPTLLLPADRISLLIGLGALGIALIATGVWWLRRPSPDNAPSSSQESVSSADAPADDAETLMDAIIALDDQFRAGRLPETAYRQRREALKNRLRAVTSQNSQGPAND